MAGRHERAHASFHGMADRLTALKLGLHAVRRHLRRHEVPESAAVTAQLTRLDREVDAAASALLDLAPQDGPVPPDHAPR